MSEENVGEDPDCRRSSRKRRKINYKSNEKQRYIITTVAPKPISKSGKRRGRPPKLEKLLQDCPVIKTELIDEAQTNRPTYPMRVINKMIDDLVFQGDRDTIRKVIKRLQKSLKPIAHIKEDTISIELATDDPEIIRHSPSEELTCGSLPETPNTPNKQETGTKTGGRCSNYNELASPGPHMLQPTSTVPANLHTKSVSVHGNNVIMQGVINTGTSQQSCYLIPIDINNIARLQAGGVQMIGGPAPAPGLMSPGQQQQPTNSSVMVSSQSGNMIISPVAPTNHHLQQRPPSNQTPVSSVHVQNAATSSGIGCSGGPVAPPSVPRPPLVNLLAAPRNPHAVGVPDKVQETLVTTTTRTEEPAGEEMAKEAGVGVAANSGTVEGILEALQSTDSLQQFLDQLSHEEMLAIVNILASSSGIQGCSEGEAGSSETESDLTKIASEIDKLTKGDNELSNAAVTQLANDISKLLADTGAIPGGDVSPTSSSAPDMSLSHNEDDEDFHHANISSTSEITVKLPPGEEPRGGPDGLRCMMCGLICTDNNAFFNHMRFHLFNYRYSCYECGYGTSSMNELLLHKSESHDGDLTKISPDFLKQLPKSERIDSPDLEDTLIKCPECKEDIPLHSIGPHINQKHKYSSHKISPGRKPKCTICTALVDNRNELAAHVTHHGKDESSFACYFCTQHYTSINALQLHTTSFHATQAARRHYQCEQCSRQFSGSYHLIRHIKTVHEQRRDYQCSKCDKSFVELHCLRRHIRNIHNLIRDHTCPVCNRGFTYRQDMFRHIMSVHQKIRDIKCPLCNEKFYHRHFIGHAARAHDLKVKYRDGICYIYDDAGNVIHKIT